VPARKELLNINHDVHPVAGRARSTCQWWDAGRVLGHRGTGTPRRRTPARASPIPR